MPKYNYRDSMKSSIDHYDTEIASIIKQIKTLETRCALYQKRRKEYYLLLKEFEKRKRKENA